MTSSGADRPLAAALAGHDEITRLLPVISSWPDPVHVVGGAVRDLLLGAAHVDVDLVVVGDAVALARELAARLPGLLTVHGAFGTATVAGDGVFVDLATARSETYPSPGALPVVRPATLPADLARRDFTINAMAASLGSDLGALIDPFDGRADLERGVLRVLHDRSFVDDPTRIVRGVRYEARLGFGFDADTAALARVAATGVGALSPERLREALVLLLREACAGAALDRLDDLGALGVIGLRGVGEEIAAADAFAATNAPDAEPWLYRLAVAAVDVVAVAERLRLRRGDAARLTGDAAESLVARAVRVPAEAAAIARHLRHDRHVRLEVDGSDVMRELGLAGSPRVGEVLADLLRRKIAGELPDRAAELAALRSLSGGDGG
jgi:tRNA nucleotidyltransferase (CCA-adding enzyme)